jgi:hypothetical protein
MRPQNATLAEFAAHSAAPRRREHAMVIDGEDYLLARQRIIQLRRVRAGI